ncbi:MAG: tubulin-like doman-containing protein, partial [Armatimonadota bacterium]|nr:tubulin-like doman-containing protein [Armatimonadota bacterium]
MGSLLGGTCSGMFLDMAYIAGKLIPASPDIIGIFSIPALQGGRQDHRANAYAALLELNHYCYPHTVFTAQYSPTQPEFRNRREPFTYTYLVGMNNGQQQIGSVQEQVSLVGHSIFLDLTSEFQAQKRSNRDNFQQFLVHSDRIGCPQSFMSFGLSAIHFPKDKVISACAFRLAAETVTGWLSTQATYSDEQLHRYVTDRLTELKLLPGEVNGWLRMSGDGVSLDNEIDGWREHLNEELVSTRPPATMLASTITQHDANLQQNFRDVDPNADVLRKNPESLGTYARQVQRNLVSRGLQQIPRELEGWVERMVDDPHYRQSTARAALLRTREVFVQAAKGLDAAVQQNFAPAEPPREQAKEAALQKLHADAGSLLLKMVPGAYAETINQDREEALHSCSTFYRSRLDTLVARHAARLYHELPPIVDRLIADLDAYMVKLEAIRNDFKNREGETIASPVFVNGERLWDRDTDVDNFYKLYATAEKKDNVSAAAARSLVGGGRLYSLRKLDDAALRRTLVQSAAGVFASLKDDVDVLSRFFQKYPDPAKRMEAMRQVYRVSQPFLDLKPAFYQSAEDFVALEGKRQTVVGIHNGSQPGTPQEGEFRNLLNQIERLAPEKFALLNNRYEVLFLRESAAFPLRLLREVDQYRLDYEFFATQGATQNPLHVRKDVARWEPIYVPGSYAQDAAWETFSVGWGCGVIQDNV